MTIRDPSKSIEKPVASLVRRPDGEERVKMRPPMIPIADDIWNDAFNEAADSLALSIVRRGGHRKLEDVTTDVIAHVDKNAMAVWLAQKMVQRLAAIIGDELEIDLDLQVDQVETAASGTISAIYLTTGLGDAATIFNCNAAVSLTGEVETLRDRTGALRPAEWGLLFYRLVGFLDVVRTKDEDIYLSIFAEMRRSGLVREAMVRCLDQQRLKKTLFGDFPLSMDRGGRTLH